MTEQIVKCDRCGQIKTLGRLLRWDEDMAHCKGLCVECAKDTYDAKDEWPEALNKTLDDINERRKNMEEQKDDRQVDPVGCDYTECLTGEYRPAVDQDDYDRNNPKESPTKPQEWERKSEELDCKKLLQEILEMTIPEAEKHLKKSINNERLIGYANGRSYGWKTGAKMTLQELKDELVKWCEERKSSCLEEFDTAKDRYIRGCLEGMADAFDEVINLIKNL